MSNYPLKLTKINNIFWGGTIIGPFESKIGKLIARIISLPSVPWGQLFRGWNVQGALAPRKNVRGNIGQGRFIMASF
jgi:hypothetical protein